MRLFRGIFSSLAAQALLAAIVPGGLAMVFVMHESQQAELVQRDRERLDAFVQVAAEAARAGRPLDQVAQLPGPLAGRASCSWTRRATRSPGRPLSRRRGPRRPVQVDGRTVATARIVRPPELSDQDRRVLCTPHCRRGRDYRRAVHCCCC